MKTVDGTFSVWYFHFQCMVLSLSVYGTFTFSVWYFHFQCMVLSLSVPVVHKTMSTTVVENVEISNRQTFK